MTNHPRVQYRQSEWLWTNCNQIMVGSRTLWDFLYGVLTGPTYHDLPAQYWRDTSPSYYILHGFNGSRLYVDGSDTIDIPDFHSLDISAGFGSYGVPLNFNMSFIDDRFGNQYLTLPDIGIDQSLIEVILKSGGKNTNLSFPVGVGYSEGYVCTGGHSISDCVRRSTSSIPGSQTVFNTIKGACSSAGGTLALGMRLVACAGGTSAVVYSYGYAASIGTSGSIGRPTGYDPSSGWNWAIEDRLNGVSYVDLVLKAKSREQ